jgi:hypothetical protein
MLSRACVVKSLAFVKETTRAVALGCLPNDGVSKRSSEARSAMTHLTNDENNAEPPCRAGFGSRSSALSRRTLLLMAITTGARPKISRALDAIPGIESRECATAPLAARVRAALDAAPLDWRARDRATIAPFRYPDIAVIVG